MSADPLVQAVAEALRDPDDSRAFVDSANSRFVAAVAVATLVPLIAERIALAIEAAADEHNRNIARIAGLPYDPDRHDGAVANGLRRAARIARETT
jgi:hypothetical protein